MSSTTTSSRDGLIYAYILGVRVVASPYASVIDAVEDLLRADARPRAYLCPTGVHGVMEARKDPAFRSILNSADFNVADGMPLVMASRLLGHTQSERAFGPEVMMSIVERSVSVGARHFFYGGREGVARRLADALTDRSSGLEVAGTYCPPFRALTEAEEDEVADLINSSGADVVWVGLSTPKQERWIARMRHKLDVKLICSVGAAFDYHTGSIKPAPAWMKRAALEWLYRLMQEPRRLWRRYFEIVPKFLFLITLQLTGLKTFSEDG